MTLTDVERDYVAAATVGDVARVAELAAIIDSEEAERNARLNAPDALVKAALWYAGQGVPVFPCREADKRPATVHGFKDATTDAEQIAAWWRANPNCNIGAPTGIAFDVFDVDGPGGTIAIGRHLDSGKFPPVLAVARTPRGQHLFVAPSGRGKTTTNLLSQVDYRGLGGYVVLPPSRTPAGVYRWAHDRPLRPELLGAPS